MLSALRTLERNLAKPTQTQEAMSELQQAEGKGRKAQEQLRPSSRLGLSPERAVETQL